MPDILELTRDLSCSNWLFPFSLDSSGVLEKMLMFDIHAEAPSHLHLRSPYDDAAALRGMLGSLFGYSSQCRILRVPVSSFD